MVNDFQFYLYSILAVIILSLAVAFSWKIHDNAYFDTNSDGDRSIRATELYDNLEWQPLLGYAAFLAVLSFVITMSIWVVNRNRKHSKELRQAEETIEEAERKKEI